MCGIIGYIGKKNAVTVGLDCLKQLEYRGYDSSGTAFFDNVSGKIISSKAIGRIYNLEEKIKPDWDSRLAIFHTRWATHGQVNEANAHPHSDCRGEVWLVHNGIIENYKELQEKLSASGHKFKSKTDTEVVAHLIEEEFKNSSFEEAVRLALQKVKGNFL